MNKRSSKRLENNCKTLLEKKKITIASLLVTLPS